MGMLKEGVRLDRVRGGRQKYRRNPEGPYQVAAQPIKRISIDGEYYGLYRRFRTARVSTYSQSIVEMFFIWQT